MSRSAFALLAWMVSTAFASASVACKDTVFEELSFTVCETQSLQKIDLHLRDGEQVIGSFRRLEALEGPLPFATNAGMYHPDRRPVGHFLKEGTETMRVVTSPGPGNFGMLPNGVFCVTETRALVLESRAYLDAPPECRIATQSGPLLVIENALHPRFIPGSTALNIRNGVGVSQDGQRVAFAISNQPVNFDTFARLFRDVLDLPNALYLDGRISRFHAPQLGRSDAGLPMGPILSVRP